MVSRGVLLLALSSTVGCGGSGSPPPWPGSPTSPPVVAQPLVVSTPAPPPSVRAPGPPTPSPKIAAAPPISKPDTIDKPAQITPGVTIWQSPLEPLLRSLEEETVRQRDRAKFEAATQRLREQFVDDRDALIALGELEAKLWRDIFSDRSRQIESLSTLRELFARQAYDDEVRTGWNGLQIGKLFAELNRRHDAFVAYAEILKIPLDVPPFFLAPSRSDDGFTLNHSQALQHALEVGRTEELPSLDAHHFASGYVQRLFPHLTAKLRNMHPSNRDRDFEKKEADFFRTLLTKIPAGHVAREDALKLQKMDW